MKRIITLALALTLVFCLSGCKKDGTAEIATDEGTSVVETSSNITSTNTSEPKKSNKDKNLSNTPSTSTKPIHTHSFSDATCAEPQKCSCGVTKGVALGHSWQEATCNSPKSCTVCRRTEGAVGTHAIENEMCKYCKQVVVVSPENLDTTKSYIYCFGIDDHEAQGDYYTKSIEVHNIDFSERMLGRSGVYSSNLYQYSDKNKKISYNNEIYYHLYGGKGVAFTYEINKKEIILRHKGEPTQYAILNLLSNNKLKVVNATNGFCGNFSAKEGWLYEISKLENK